MIIQDLAETSDGDLEQVKWNILLKYFIFHLENTETYYEGDKKNPPTLYRMSPEGNANW